MTPLLTLKMFLLMYVYSQHNHNNFSFITFIRLSLSPPLWPTPEWPLIFFLTVTPNILLNQLPCHSVLQIALLKKSIMQSM
jgi:hypothetical protein